MTTNLKPIIFSQHAADRLAEGQLSVTGVESVVRRPTWTEPQPGEPGVERRFGPATDHPDKVLRVVVREDAGEITVVTAFPDRRAKRQMQRGMKS